MSAYKSITKIFKIILQTVTETKILGKVVKV